MEHHSKNSSYKSAEMADILNQLHVGSSSQGCHQSRQSDIGCKPMQSYDYNFEHSKNVSASQSISSSVPLPLTPAYRRTADRARHELYNEQSVLKGSNSVLSPYYSHLYGDDFNSKGSSACRPVLSTMRPTTDLYYSRNIVDGISHSRPCHSKDGSILNRKSKMIQVKAPNSKDLPHISDVRASSDRYISPNCYDPYSTECQSFLDERKKEASHRSVYPHYSDAQVGYPIDSNAYKSSLLRYEPQSEYSSNYLYDGSTLHQKPYSLEKIHKKSLIEGIPGNEMNGYFHENMPNPEIMGLEHGITSLDLLNESENADYHYADYLTNTAFTSKETVEVLGPEEVRWFYKTEGEKKWTPFIGYDSIKIEWAYRELLHKSITKDRGLNTPYESLDAAYDYMYETVVQPTEKPVVCGGLYEVDVSTLKAYSIYWEAEEFTIMRGTWFYEGSWMPIEANIAKHIEMEHLAQFQGTHITSDMYERDSQQGVIHSITLSEGEVDWFSPCDVFFTHDATPSRLMRSVSKKLGFQKTGYKLHRGYCIDASSDDKPTDINHIVFVIHGIGQKMETGRIIKNCTSLRENVKWLKEKQFPGCDFTNQTVEFFPVEWRSSLVLDAGIIESITPHKIIGLRQMLNASFMDIMYYNSPQYREEIVNGLTAELDRLYTMFTARNPYFEANGGKVSVIAHSLGCVITYDIVTGWCPAPQMSQSFLQALINLTQRKAGLEGETTLNSFQNALQVVLQQQLEKSSQPRLKFKIENFFCLGSPLAVFLGLRRKRQENVAPATVISDGSFARLFNIFHPADPVAYRIEPLICPKYSSVAPVTIHTYSSVDKMPYCEIPPEALSTTPRPGNRSDTPAEQIEADTMTTLNLPTTPSKGTAAWNFWNFMKQPKKGTDSSPSNKSVEDMNVRDLLKHRIDFVLREGSMESSYLSALTSHTSYWGNMDIAFFLLSTFCPHILEKSS